jgi:dihydrofolate reductase
MFSIIAAVSKNNGLGKDGGIPWNEPDDMRFFRNMTSSTFDKTRQNAVIMGRLTYESLKGRSLPNRKMIVISSIESSEPNWFKNLDAALDSLCNDSIEQIFVIGGGQLYSEAILNNRCINIYLNHINTDVECDVFFPTIDEDLYDLCSENQLTPNILARHYRNKQFKLG